MRINDKEFASITGPSGKARCSPSVPIRAKSRPQKRSSRSSRHKNIDPEGYTLYTYAAFQVWSQAVAKAGSTDPKKVIDTIKAGEWDTVLGKMAFDSKGDIKRSTMSSINGMPRAATRRSTRGCR